jgi:hypothetical protein
MFAKTHTVSIITTIATAERGFPKDEWIAKQNVEYYMDGRKVSNDGE